MRSFVMEAKEFWRWVDAPPRPWLCAGVERPPPARNSRAHLQTGRRTSTRQPTWQSKQWLFLWLHTNISFKPISYSHMSGAFYSQISRSPISIFSSGNDTCPASSGRSEYHTNCWWTDLYYDTWQRSRDSVNVVELLRCDEKYPKSRNESVRRMHYGV